MDAYTQSYSEFSVQLFPPETSFIPQELYSACKKRASIVSCNFRNLPYFIRFEQLSKKDRRKLKRTVRIDDNITLVLKWKKDFHHHGLPPAFPLQVPEQQSEAHILNALNDDCLRELFGKLSVIDICTVLDVCQRFRNVALTLKPKDVQVTRKSCQPLWKVERYFSTFGASIKRAHITADRSSEIVVNFVLEHCANIAELTGSPRVDIHSLTKISSLFPRLRRIHITHIGIADMLLKPNDEIESIQVGFVSTFPPIHYPKLRDVHIHIRSEWERSRQFFQLNKHIERVRFVCTKHPIIPSILEKLPELQIFEASHLCSDSIVASEIDRKLCELKRLHTIELIYPCCDTISIICEIGQHCVQLKRLKLIGIKDLTDSNIDRIINIKKLEYFEIEQSRDDNLVKLISNCIYLKELKMVGPDIPFQCIRAASIHLKKFTFQTNVDQWDAFEFRLDSNKFDEIAKIRATKSIDIRGVMNLHENAYIKNKDIIERILDQHSQWITIDVNAD